MRVYMRIKGRVQGVGFRFFVSETAQNMSLTGWVRNLPDGGVDAEAQGGEKNIEAALKKIQSGHPWARVDKISSEKIPDRSGETGFEIRP